MQMKYLERLRQKEIIISLDKLKIIGDFGKKKLHLNDGERVTPKFNNKLGMKGEIKNKVR